MEKIDVVILSDLNTQKEVTEWTIQTLRDSEVSYLSHCKYNVNVVSKTTDVQISNTNVICVNEPFNYNRFLNIGFQHLTDAEWVLISNNDVSYERDWLLEILHIHKMRPATSSTLRAVLGPYPTSFRNELDIRSGSALHSARRVLHVSLFFFFRRAACKVDCGVSPFNVYVQNEAHRRGGRGTRKAL
jgi:hypothetical protein